MRQYQDLLRTITWKGVDKGDRTGTGTRSLFGYQMRFDLQDGFPLVTTKKVFTKAIIHELIWLLSGDTNIKYLKDNGVTIWDEWADEDGDLGPVYGQQWRSWQHTDLVGQGGEISFHLLTVDQIDRVVEDLRSNPDSRRHIVSAWNVGQIELMALPPCHTLFQFYSRPMGVMDRYREFTRRGLVFDESDSVNSASIIKQMDGAGIPTRALDCQLYQRSADVFLGVPFNIASYALLTMMVAQVTDHAPGDFVHTFGDVHIYKNHIEQVREQLSRPPRQLPTMRLNPAVKEIDDFTYADFTLEGYDPHPAIKGEVAV